MSNLNTNLLIDNIHELMKKHGIKQIELAKKIGMSQPNLSKALNKNDKKTFTLEQVVDIAACFQVTVDSLLSDAKDSTTDGSHSLKEIGQLLYFLIENNIAKINDFEKEETFINKKDHNSLYDTSSTEEKRKINYPSIYFPDYWYPRGDEWDDFNLVGDNHTDLQPLNVFLRSYEELIKARESYSISEETIRTVAESHISGMDDELLQYRPSSGDPVPNRNFDLSDIVL